MMAGNMAKRSHQDFTEHLLVEDPNKRRQSESKPMLKTATAFYGIAPWVASEISEQLPPLPEIKDEILAEQVFRHPGMSGGADYTVLEFAGDAHLESLSSMLIIQTFKEKSAGQLSQIREQLVRNTTLAGYFVEYGLEARAKVPPEILRNEKDKNARTTSASKDITKTRADMFEAYVAAIILSDPENGRTTCNYWLRALWSRTIKDQIISANAAETTNSGSQRLKPKEELAKSISVRGISIQYKDLPGKEKMDRNMKLPLFTVGVYLTGWGEQDLLMGIGTDMNKKEAGQIAATRAMENKKLMKRLMTKKAGFVEKQKAAEV